MNRYQLMNRLFPAILLAIISILAGCKHTVPSRNENSAPPSPVDGTPQPGTASCDPDTIYFQQQVLPILVSNCTMSGCHDAASHQDGVILTSYNTVMKTAEIVPGNPRESELYERITDRDARERMPLSPAPSLSEAQIAIIYKWILQGANNNSCENSCDSSAAVTYGQQVRSIIAANCTGCHCGTSPQAGINLSTYAGLNVKVDDGRFWGAINHLPGYSAMPKNGTQLSECERTQIKKWIDAGAPNN